MGVFEIFFLQVPLTALLGGYLQKKIVDNPPMTLRAVGVCGPSRAGPDRKEIARATGPGRQSLGLARSARVMGRLYQTRVQPGGAELGPEVARVLPEPSRTRANFGCARAGCWAGSAPFDTLTQEPFVIPNCVS